MSSVGANELACLIATSDRKLHAGMVDPDPTVVSYPDPNVRNDDHRLQYDITYRGSSMMSYCKQ